MRSERASDWLRAAKPEELAAEPRTVIDALPDRMTRTLRRAGVRTNRDAQALSCASLAARRRIGPRTVRAVIDAFASEKIRLVCGCGWDGDGDGVRFCNDARKLALHLL